MSQFDEREEWYSFNEETIEALLEDGSQADAEYTIEHHFASNDFDKLEKAAVDTFKAGFEVTDAEELMLDDGGTIFCFDAIIERALDLAKLNADSDTLLKIADKQDVQYDGWGTYFMPRGDDEDEYEDDYLED
ncbi:ribonuclease E inhibitor RraB [Alteromonas sp. K632G]|jgi:regulator of RNase E activity RraB|uniref:Regulator of ribonuclease activity B n=1 Tax=Alteromonas naphthalenivorans TaxID=715451 RepID=F5Z9K0_ALTNA|nr:MULTISPECIES: ribonuclease E inhibitor RraB [Alteromonas]AEF01845.1 RNase E inhibitor protein [Alteromonas naphthalenivorans]MBB66361.1 ribonuclease E inhibitor RraB [Rickettsiales bacterium]MBO7923147.1 ribonuclease E inhibitor RraB [Alteromonas sp. K632G]PHS52033.1 MAG: ribonuclease E inhibitor RraB [Alteromonas sp.]|tara:strand:+ start:126 stop:524 length:399 start_codon:yes stop_codon:yes gene_type:complete